MRTFRGTLVSALGPLTLAGALGVALALALAAPAAAVGQHSIIAQQRGVSFAAGAMLVRLADATLPADGAPVTHVHPPGFTYAVGEPHALTLGGGRTLLAPGQAAWVGNQEEHTHARGSTPTGTPAGRFYFIGVFPSAARGTAPPGGISSLFRDSEDVVLAAGAYDVVLSEARFPAAGDTVTVPAQRGPMGVWLVEGQASLGGQALVPDGVALVRPGAGATLTSAGGGARVLVLAVLPSGTAAAAAQLPRTGSAGTAVPLVLGLALATALATATAGLTFVQRRLRA